MHQEQVQRPLDQLAITLSGLCILHCLLTPILLATFPILAATFVTDADFHRMLLWLILPASVLALSLGCARHKDKLALSLGLVGMIQLVFTITIGHEVFGENGERLATAIGGVIVALGHIRNHQLCRRDLCET